jgi:hypothetical protein
MRLTRRTAPLLICTALAFVVCNAGPHAQEIAIADGIRRATPWGDPDLRGRYIRVSGTRHVHCGTYDEAAFTLSPIHSGVTLVQQIPGYIRIRNQFGTTRTWSLNDDDHGRRDTARWDGDTLVVQWSPPPAGATATGAGVRVTERFTPVDADALNYTFAVSDSSADTIRWTFGFTLNNTAAGTRASGGSTMMSQADCRSKRPS